MSELTLVVLAAGTGTRYGGMKQLEPIGPGGATLMEYSIFDALREGFTRIVLVVGPDTEVAGLARGAGSRVPLEIVSQHTPALAPAAPRLKPWGTGHALLEAQTRVTAPFAVLNADDCYGREALRAAAGFLKQNAEPAPSYAVIAFRLGRTMSPAGGVNRAVLFVDERGDLGSIAEVRDLRPATGGGFVGRESDGERYYPADALVSMNLWAFNPSVFPLLEDGFRAFIADAPGAEAEYYLPEAVDRMMRRSAASVRVLPTSSPWCGLTHPQDRAQVAATLRDLVDAGEYPKNLWA